MNANNNCQGKTGANSLRSYFDWDCNMQVIRKGNGKIAMTESELARFFGVTWRKLNYRLQTIIKSSNLHPGEGVQERRKSLSMDCSKAMHRYIHFLSSSFCPLC